MKKAYLNILIVFIPVLFISGCQKENNGSSGNTWKKLADMPTARHHFGLVESNGMLYAIGGYNANGLNTVEQYNPSSNTWQTKTNMPTARGYLVVVSVSDKIYAIGGITGGDLNNITYLNQTEQYDPATDQWTVKSPIPISYTASFNSVLGNLFISGSAINGKIYVFAGASGTDIPTFIYDPILDSWQIDSSIAISKFNFEPYFTVNQGNDMYVYNGHDFLKYASVDSQWNVLNPLLIPRLGACLASDNSKIYSIGGASPDSNKTLNEVDMYDISNSSWQKTSSLNVARHSAGALTYNGNLYVAGGAVSQSNFGDVPISSLEVLALK